jgi:hypothetical protein
MTQLAEGGAQLSAHIRDHCVFRILDAFPDE